MPTKNKTNWGAIERESAAAAHKEQVNSLQCKIEEYAERLKDAETSRDVALGIRNQKVFAPKITAKPDGPSEATAFALAGDWHVEETVESKTVNGLNEFNLIIAEKRIECFFRSVLKLVAIERTGATIDNLVLVLLGDLMTGYIHEELQESNGLSPTETVLWLRKRIIAGVKMLRREGAFKRIVIPCVFGNHGRTTKKPRNSTAAVNSYEWMLYNILRDDLPDCEWHIADGYFLYLEVYGKEFRIHHGDNVTYGGGIGGLTIPAEKAIASWNKARTPYIDIFAHHHQSFQTPRWICNGPLIGYNAYSLAIKAGFEPPSQTFFLLDSKRGRTGTFPIFLSDL
jgi:hypothetical protein